MLCLAIHKAVSTVGVQRSSFSSSTSLSSSPLKPVFFEKENLNLNFKCQHFLKRLDPIELKFKHYILLLHF